MLAVRIWGSATASDEPSWQEEHWRTLSAAHYRFTRAPPQRR